MHTVEHARLHGEIIRGQLIERLLSAEGDIVFWQLRSRQGKKRRRNEKVGIASLQVHGFERGWRAPHGFFQGFSVRSQNLLRDDFKLSRGFAVFPDFFNPHASLECVVRDGPRHLVFLGRKSPDDFFGRQGWWFDFGGWRRSRKPRRGRRFHRAGILCAQNGRSRSEQHYNRAKSGVTDRAKAHVVCFIDLDASRGFFAARVTKKNSPAYGPVSIVYRRVNSAGAFADAGRGTLSLRSADIDLGTTIIRPEVHSTISVGRS